MSEVMTGVFIMWHIAFSCVLGLDYFCTILPFYSEIPDIRNQHPPLLIRWICSLFKVRVA